MEKLIFMSSMPRSGSTLLTRILSQNPNIYSSPTSALLDIILTLRNTWNQFVDHKATPPDSSILPRILRSIPYTYYDHIKNPIVLDKSRGHNGCLDLWEYILQEKPKVIVTYRDIPDIIVSMEKLHKKTALVRQPPYEREFPTQMGTLSGRAAIWTMQEHLIGAAYTRITEAIRTSPECLHFVHFDQLTRYPELTLKRIYKFIDEKEFPHDFNNVPTTNVENDDVHGYVDLHETRAKVEWIPSRAKEILGEELFGQYTQYNLKINY